MKQFQAKQDLDFIAKIASFYLTEVNKNADLDIMGISNSAEANMNTISHSKPVQEINTDILMKRSNPSNSETFQRSTKSQINNRFGCKFNVNEGETRFMN